MLQNLTPTASLNCIQFSTDRKILIKRTISKIYCAIIFGKVEIFLIIILLLILFKQKTSNLISQLLMNRFMYSKPADINTIM